MGPRISSSTGAGVWSKAPGAFPDSNSVQYWINVGLRFYWCVGIQLRLFAMFLLPHGMFGAH